MVLEGVAVVLKPPVASLPVVLGPVPVVPGPVPPLPVVLGPAALPPEPAVPPAPFDASVSPLHATKYGSDKVPASTRNPKCLRFEVVMGSGLAIGVPRQIDALAARSLTASRDYLCQRVPSSAGLRALGCSRALRTRGADLSALYLLSRRR